MRGTRGGRGPEPPPPKMTKIWGFLAIQVRSPEKSQSYQASIQYRAIIGTPPKRPLIVVLDPPSPYHISSLTKLSGSPHVDPQRLRPLKVVLGSSLPLSTKKNVVKVGPPFTKLSGSPHGDPQRLRPACAYAQSDQSLCYMYSLENSMTVKLLTEQRLEFLNLKGGCTGSPESTLVKIPHCWKQHVAAHISKAVLKCKV